MELRKRNYEDNNLSKTFISVKTFIDVWCVFVLNQLWNFDYKCLSCGTTTPQFVVCDGLSVNLSKYLCKNAINLFKSSENEIPKQVSQVEYFVKDKLYRTYGIKYIITRFGEYNSDQVK